jgi:hypothetical protein
MHLLITSAAMFESNYVLMCLRLAADCRNLAADVPEPDLRTDFLRMAGIWTEMAVEPRVLH